jgi:very-short-patch-repair endonuclease
MSESERILQYVEENEGMKARKIANRLRLDKSDVNSVLYSAKNKGLVEQDDDYRWYPAGSDVGGREESAETKDTPLARISRYYLECLSQDIGTEVSVFATSKYNDLDYAELSTFPPIDGESPFGREETRDLLHEVRADPRGKMLYAGYPVRLRYHEASSGWEGFFVDPVCLFPYQIDPDNQYEEPSLADEVPLFNEEVLRRLKDVNSGKVTDEAIQLADELGLTNVGGEMPDLDDVFLRLQSVRPEWDWVEDPDPLKLQNDQPLGEITDSGIYNRCVLVIGERPPYTQGLEVELGKLARLEREEYADTALGTWVEGASIDSTTPGDQPLLEILPLNAEQRRAIVQGLNNKLTVVTGPPGTGKSQVVTSLLANAAWQGKRVLFASKNHKAVDVVEERVNNLGPRPILLRVGPNEYQERLSRYLTQILAATSTESDQQNYQHHLDVHERLRNEYGNLQSELDEVVELRNRVDRLEQKVEPIRDELGNEIFQELRSLSVSDLERKQESFESALAQATKSEQSIFTRLLWPFVKDSRYDRLLEEARHLEDLVEKLGISLPGRSPDDLTIDRWQNFAEELQDRTELAKEARQYFDALDKLETARQPEEIAAQRNELQSQIAENSSELWSHWLRLQPSRLSRKERETLSEYTSLLQMIVEANNEDESVGKKVFAKYYDLFPKVAETLTCWAITSLSARRIPFEPGFFDLVVIDEASQCDIASALPLLYRAKQAVIIGDPQQLKHISSVTKTQDQQLLEKYGLVEDYSTWTYSVNSLFDLSRSICDGEDIVSLRDHHRSHSDIISFANEHFYDGRLRVATDYDRLRMPSENEPSVRWIDVSARVKQPSGGGAINPEEASAIVDELERIVLEQEYRGTVGVVTPFRDQASRIRDHVKHHGDLASLAPHTNLLVDTVHKFQGDERDVMLFSPVVGKGMSDGSLYFLRKNGYLFNVAITRARSSLVVVGDRSAARSSDIDYLEEFAEYVQSLENGEEGGHGTKDFGPEYPDQDVSHPVSEWEKILYRALYQEGIQPIPQKEVDQYTLDLALMNGTRKLDIEVDGERYHRDWDGELQRRDQLRTQRLVEMGWDVVRFWVYEVRDDLDRCVERVLSWKEAAASSTR